MMLSVTHSAVGPLCLVALAGCSTVHVLDDDTSSSSSIGGAAATNTTSLSSSSNSTGGAGTTSTASTSSSANSTGGGGADTSPRIITLEHRGNGHAPIDDGRVLLSDEDGTLRESFLPSELPVEVEVNDGQLVSFFRRELSLRVDSFRVTPSVTTTIVGGVTPIVSCGDVEPMTVTVDFAEVATATEYRVVAPVVTLQPVAPQPGLLTFEVRTCDVSFVLVAYARASGTILGYELFDALPFVPGGHLDLSTSANSIDRGPLDITIEGLEGALSLTGTAFWHHPPLPPPADSAPQLLQMNPPPDVLWSPAPILPGGPGYGYTVLSVSAVFSNPNGGCSNRFGHGVGAFAPGVSQTISFDQKLARVEAVGDSGWTFAEAGDLGDTVGVFMHLGGDEEPFWYLAEDPTFPATAPSFPELPSDLAAELIPPTTTPTLEALTHYDRGGVSGYGELVSGVVGGGSFRASYGCD